MVTPKISGGSSMMKKKTKGRIKIDIKKIDETNRRQVTFSKRRTGLFKKATELCVLTGAEIAILVSSPGGRVFAFGHPNADILVDRYLNDNNKEFNAAATQKSPLPLPMKELNQHYVEVSKELDAEKKRGETIPVSSGAALRWYEEPVDGMNEEELQGYLCSLEELKKKVLTRADELMMINKSCACFGSNMYQLGWNNGIQPVDIPTNAAVDSGFPVQYAGDGGNF